MPELPEVEVVKQSLDKKIKEKKVRKVLVRNRNLRKKVPFNFEKFFLNENNACTFLRLWYTDPRYER